MEPQQRKGRVEQALASLDGIRRAEAPPFLYTRIAAQLGQQKSSGIRPRLVWQIAVSLCLVMAFNIWGSVRFLQQEKQSTPSGNGVQQVAQEYFGSSIAY